MKINQTEKILKALANRRRIKIVKYLAENKKACVTELAGHLGLSFKSTSKHIAVLKNADLIEAEQVSLNNYYQLVRPLHAFVRELLVIV
jgi:ArsR family transcriptional regulator